MEGRGVVNHTVLDSPRRGRGEGSPLLGAGLDGHGAGSKQLTWKEVAFMMTALIIGLGVLGIPWAIAAVGYAVGVGMLVASALGAIYSGVWIGRICAFITATSGPPHKYCHLGQAAFGAVGRGVVKAVQYTFLGGCIVAVQLTASKSLHQILEGRLCLVLCNVAVAVAALPVMQIQSLKDVTWVAVLGILAILAPLIMYLVELDRKPGASAPSLGPPPHLTFDHAVNGIMTLVFAYQGQTVFPEFLAQMERPQHFNRAVVSSTAFMTAVYLVVGIAGYRIMGGGSEYLSDYVNDEEGRKPITTAANVLLIIHVAAGYIINGNVMNHALFDAVVGSRGDGKGGSAADQRPAPRLAWFLVTLHTVLVALVLANLIPGLSSLLSILGATCGLTLTFAFPATFALKLLGPSLGPRDRALHYAVLAFVLVAIGLGSYATGRSLVEKIVKAGAPFSCR